MSDITPNRVEADPETESNTEPQSTARRYRRRVSWLPMRSRTRAFVGWTALLLAAAVGIAGVWQTRSSIDWSRWYAVGRDLSQILAVGVGAIWAYRRFVRQREHQPRATIHHLVDTFALDEDHRYVRIHANVKNIGQVAIAPPNLIIEVRQFLPMSPELAAKLHDLPSSDPDKIRPYLPLLGMHEVDLAADRTLLDPGEDNDFLADFVVGSNVELVEVTSTLTCDSEPGGLAWYQTSLQRLSAAAVPSLAGLHT